MVLGMSLLLGNRLKRNRRAGCATYETPTDPVVNAMRDRHD
jgi:hypothetical protein